MIKFVIVAAALASGTAALAAKPGPETIEVSAAKAQSGARICVSEGAITGSILDRRTCLTRQQWEARGVKVVVK